MEPQVHRDGPLVEYADTSYWPVYCIITIITIFLKSLLMEAHVYTAKNYVTLGFWSLDVKVSSLSMSSTENKRGI